MRNEFFAFTLIIFTVKKHRKVEYINMMSDDRKALSLKKKSARVEAERCIKFKREQMVEF